MKQTLFLLFNSVLVSLPAQADIARAEQALRTGEPAAALQALRDTAPCPELHYWKGRALTELQHYEQAIAEFARIGEEHALYPYAAKGIMYCARRCGNTAELLAPVCKSSRADIALRAQMLRAEHLLSQGQNVTLAELKSRAESPDAKAALMLMEAEQLLRSGRFDAAINICRDAEEHAPTLQREYSRIILGEIYYAKEQAAGDDEGKGEETLLKFISAYPESVLLEEAFRRLDRRGAFQTSQYATRKLEEWARDASCLTRALLASSIMQREALYTHANEELGEIAVNRATGINPDYLPITVRINNEQARFLDTSGNKTGALSYTDRIPENKRDAYTLFYKAHVLPATDPMAAELYLQCAQVAPPELQETALSNALYCAHVNEDENTIHRILAAELTQAAKRAVKLTHAGLNLRKSPQNSRTELEEILQMQPTPKQYVETILQLTQLDLDENNSASVLNRLTEFSNQDRAAWPNEQVMRYYGLFLHALECEQDVGRATAIHKPFLKRVLEITNRDDVRVAVTLKLAKIYSEEGNHREALLLLEELAAKTKDKDMKARALLLAGRESTQCMTYPSVLKGASLFDAASKIDSPYRYRASILNTAILFRINQTEEATIRLNRIIREIENAREATPGSTHLAEEYAFALTVKADIEAIPGTPGALLKAVSTNEQIFTIPGLTAEWHSRVYLQQAILCTRLGKNERALLNYKNIINNLPSTAKLATPDKLYILCLSGTGAISCLLKMERWEEAAEMADSIIEHPLAKNYGERTAHFKEWARTIRKIHFLPMKEQ